MTEVVIIIGKEDVWDEVAQTTSYTGAKMEGDGDAYDRIFTTEWDRSQLERFWDESCVAVCETLKEFIQDERNGSEGFTIFLSLSSSFDTALEPSMRKELFSFFVTNIVSKWYAFANKSESGDYAASASDMLEGIRRKAYYRKKPTRPGRRVL